MPRPALAAALAALALAAGCDWPVPRAAEPAREVGPWPRLVPDAQLGLGAAAPEPVEAPDLAAREAALRARAAALGVPVIDAETAARLAGAGG